LLLNPSSTYRYQLTYHSTPTPIQIRASPAVTIDNEGVERVCLSVGTALSCIDGTPAAPSAASAVQTMDVKLLWSHKVLYSMYGSPSFSADRQRVFFPPAADFTAYALDSATGELVWSSLMPPRSDGATQGALSADGEAYFVVSKTIDQCCGHVKINSLSTKDGSWNWANDTQGTLLSSGFPAALTIDGAGTLWTITGNGTFVGLSSVSGNRTLVCNNATSYSFNGGLALARDGLLVTMYSDDRGGQISVRAFGV
jgi:hypothetical protein